MCKFDAVNKEVSHGDGQEKVTLTIDGVEVDGRRETTIMEAADPIGIRIPGCATTRT